MKHQLVSILIEFGDDELIDMNTTEEVRAHILRAVHANDEGELPRVYLCGFCEMEDGRAKAMKERMLQYTQANSMGL